MKTMKKYGTKRMLSILFTLSMVLTLMLTLPAYAASGTGLSEDDPVIITSYTEFKAAMEDKNIYYVQVGNLEDEFIKGEKPGPIAGAYVKGNKTLILAGDSVFRSSMVDEYPEADCLLYVDTGQYLKVKGSGSMTFEATLSNGYNAVIRINDGTVVIDSDNVTLRGTYHNICYGRAIMQMSGSLTINGGNFIGETAKEGIFINAVDVLGSTSTIINGGTFSANLYSGTIAKTAGLSIRDNTDFDKVQINGGTFMAGAGEEHYSIAINKNAGSGLSGIRKVANYLHHYKLYEYPAGTTLVDPATAGVTQSVIVKDPSIIENIVINVTQPVVGGTPTNATISTEGTTVNTTEWSKVGGHKMGATDKFESGETYRCLVLVYPTGDFRFITPIPTVTINGNNATINNNNTDYVLCYYDFKFPISSIDLSVTKPVAGATPSNATTSTNGTKVYVTEWKQGDYKMKEEDKFESGNDYRCYVIVNPKEGFEIPDSPTPTATINGKTATLYTQGSGYVTYYYDFKLPNRISNIALGVDKPLVGAKPSNAITSTIGTKVLGTSWLDVATNKYIKGDNKFESGKIYRCYVELEPETGFEFSTSPALSITVNGKLETTIDARSDYVVCKYEVTMPITTIALSVDHPVVGGTATNAESLTIGTKVLGTSWLDVATNKYIKGDNKFESGKIYRCYAELEPETGFEFSTSPAPTITVNGKLETTIDARSNYVVCKYEVTALPGITGTLIITGNEKFGETLTADITGLTNAGTPTYQWYRDEVAISGATAISYTLVEEDITKKIKVKVTADGVVGGGSVTSSETSAIAKADGPSAPAAPAQESKTHSTITLVANALYEFSKDNGSIWQDINTFIGLTPNTEYTFKARVKETPTTKASVASISIAITTEVTLLPQMTGIVSITGFEKFGETLTADITGLTNAGTPTYQWYRDGVAISGATASTYKLVEVDISKKINVSVTAEPTVGWGSIYSEKTLAIEKADGPAAPTGLISVNATSVGKADGKITGTTVLMEYSENISFTDTKDCQESETTGLKAGTYYMRIKATATRIAGEYATITVADKKTSSGGGISTPISYIITTSAGQGGSFDTTKTVSVKSGASTKFNIKANEGYAIEDVKVDGKSVGAINYYEFKNVSTNHTISVVFKKIEDMDPKSDMIYNFTDVLENEWYYEPIMAACEKGWFSGTSDTTFSPNTPMTRGMIVTVLWRIEGEPAANANSFNDVKAGNYYTTAVNWAAKQGIVNGYGNNLFGPNESITREQMAAILYRYAQYKGYDTTEGGMAIRKFADYGNISEYALPTLSWAVNTELIQGSGNNLMPKDSATRGQVAAILVRFSQKVAN